jgi:hypothetical protein
MTYEEADYISKPEDGNVPIWRFMDFTKFVSRIDKRSLCFCRADKLEDPFEGSYPKANVDARPEWYKDYPVPLSAIEKVWTQTITSYRRWTVVNCWHMNEHESAAMWKLYLSNREGVAIRSSFKRLMDCFKYYSDNRVLVGVVKYLDYNSEYLSERFPITAFFSKRKSFEHERELRALIFKIPINEEKKMEDNSYEFDFGLDWCQEGIYVPVDLDILVEDVFVSPFAPPWFFDLVKSLLHRYGLSWEVKQSSLSDDPVY